MQQRKPEVTPDHQRNRLFLTDAKIVDERNIPFLKLTTRLDSTPSSDAQVRIQASQDWEVIKTQTDEILKERKDNALAREQLRKTLQENAGIKSQLLANQKLLALEREQRLNHPLVYGLGTALVGIAALWLYQRRTISAQHNTFDKNTGKPDSKEGLQSISETTVPALPIAPVSIRAELLDSVGLKQDHSPSWYRKLLGVKSVKTDVIRAISEEKPSQANSLYGLDNSVELSSISGENPDTEFLDPEFAKDELIAQLDSNPQNKQSTVSFLFELRATVQALYQIDQHESAREVLLKHIERQPKTSAWAYLEYLALCVSLDQREAFEGMRQRFRVQFNRLAPYWMESPESQRDLIGHERAVAEITAVWPSHRALVLIESWLTDTAQERRIFHLTAYDDLFDLYDILTQIDEVQDELDFLPTVSLLDLDFEFAMDIKLVAEPEGAVRAVPTVKTGDFDVDVNITFGQSIPASLQADVGQLKNTPAGISLPK